MPLRSLSLVLLLVGCAARTPMKETVLAEPARYHGILCGGTVRVNDRGFTFCTLAEDLAFGGVVIPAGERVRIGPHGSTVHWEVARDVVIGGRTCKGGRDWGVTFTRDGALRSCGLVRGELVGRVQCVDAGFTKPVFFYPDGRIQSCQTAARVETADCVFERGAVVPFDRDGAPLCPERTGAASR